MLRPEKLHPHAAAMWPEAAAFIAIAVDDVRPWHELQNLILASPEDPIAPQFLIFEASVTMPLNDIGYMLFQLSPDKDRFVLSIFNTALAYKERLDAK